ncbi:sororin [Acipenser oxyrinchus oxyrinchus]|uniref:Sororin n=1 Tax=Acipenser oxyrinchus oxyrinchus TaxID=40147 RepID=A0AAD8CJJ5_ACIOX|nr:sororin [Acipenser oxyrinchus oxyrinchus]
MSTRKNERRRLASKRKNNEDHDSSLPVRRKSERTSVTDRKPAEPLLSEIGKVLAPPKKSITARKIVPRKTQAAGVFAVLRHSPRVSDAPRQIRRSPRGSLLSSGEADKENAVRRPSSSSSSFSSSPSQNAKNSEKNSPIRNDRDALNASNRKSSRNEPRSKNPLSPVSPCASRAGAPPNEEPRDQPNLIWSKKVRRSYSRLSDGSFDGTPSGSPRPDRLSLFGFGGLCGVSPVRGGGGRSLLEGAGAGVAETSPPAAEQDFDIPGVALVKEKRRRRKKVQQIQMSELDCLAAQMNAEFDAAEEFDLCVE